MKQTKSINTVEAAKTVGDPRRLAILRLLMRGPATLSQLGRELDDHPAKVRHHLKLLEEAEFVELVSTNIVRGFVEKYYQATASAFILNISILPDSMGADSVVLMGSHDLALELLAELVSASEGPPELFYVSIGSLDGLIALRQGLCDMTGCHLSENAGGDFNVSHVKHLFPGEKIALITVTHRQQGILTKQGNPKDIQSVSDFARDDVTCINRQPGSGTRLWFDQQLSDLGLAHEAIRGYEHQVRTHHQVGQAISSGEADAGIGLLAEARLMDLDFTPLFDERYDLVLPFDDIQRQKYKAFFDHLFSSEFRSKVASLGGYSSEHTGEMVIVGS
ncbi:MAG: substrate-binding domain-containing protein [Candidatus Promineifilaceae bacterium]